MHIRLLGTAAAEGWPALFCRCEHCLRARAAGGRNLRSRSAANVDGVFQFDFGPDSYHHVLAGNDLSAAEHLIMTHSHSDHLLVADLAMRRPPFAHGVPGPLRIYGNEKVLSRIGAGFADPATAGLDLQRLEPFQATAVGDATLVPLLADHDPGEQCLIYLFGRSGKWLLYGHDTGYFPDATWAAIERWARDGNRIDAALLDCTGGSQTYRRGHMGLPACTDVRDRLVQIGAGGDRTRFVVTHFSHNGAWIHDEMVQHAEPLGFEVAYDGMELDL